VLTANVLKIPEMTLRGWKQKQWWQDIESELRVQENIQLSSRLQRIVDKALGATEDRLINGDLIYDNKTGQLIRKPVNLRDAHKVAMDMIDKREALQNKTPATVAMEQIDDRLKKLADQFEQIARKTPIIEVTDVITVKEDNGTTTTET
jgi:hypothetical protein